MSAFNPEIISPLVLALAKVTAFLCIFIAAAMLLKKSSIKSILLSIALVMTPVVFVCSYTQPLLDIIPNGKNRSSQIDTANIPAVSSHEFTETVLSQVNASDDFMESILDTSVALSMDQNTEIEQSLTRREGAIGGLFVIFLVGLAVFILPLLWSFMRLAFVKKQMASGSPLEVWNKIWGASRSKHPLYFVPSPTAPCAYGVVKPCVTLPKESISWPQQKLKSTLYHEAEHLKRFDPLTRMIASVVRAVFWFHPLVWVAHRQLIHAQEECCDEAAILSGVHPEDYADELLVAAYGGSIVPKEALAMAKFSEIGRRVEKIIHFKPSQPLSSKKKVMFVVSPILCGLALSTTGFANVEETAELDKGNVAPRQMVKEIKLNKNFNASTTGAVSKSKAGDKTYLLSNYEIIFEKFTLNGLGLMANHNRVFAPEVTKFILGGKELEGVTQVVADSGSIYFKQHGRWKRMRKDILFEYDKEHGFPKALEKVLADVEEELDAKNKLLGEGLGVNHPEVKDATIVKDTMLKGIKISGTGVIRGVGDQTYYYSNYMIKCNDFTIIGAGLMREHGKIYAPYVTRFTLGGKKMKGVTQLMATSTSIYFKQNNRWKRFRDKELLMYPLDNAYPKVVEKKLDKVKTEIEEFTKMPLGHMSNMTFPGELSASTNGSVTHNKIGDEYYICSNYVMKSNKYILNGEGLMKDQKYVYAPHVTKFMWGGKELKGVTQLVADSTSIYFKQNGDWKRYRNDVLLEYPEENPFPKVVEKMMEEARSKLAKLNKSSIKKGELKPVKPEPPIAKWAPGEIGEKVVNPFSGKLLDVRGVPAGALVKDPNDKDPRLSFRIPKK